MLCCRSLPLISCWMKIHVHLSETPFVEKTILSVLKCLSILVKNDLIIDTRFISGFPVPTHDSHVYPYARLYSTPGSFEHALKQARVLRLFWFVCNSM